MFVELRRTGNKPIEWAESLGHKTNSVFSLWKSIKTRLGMYGVSDALWRQIRKRSHRNQSVLDAGCGMGEWVAFLNQHGLRADGLDFSSSMIDANRKQWPNFKWVHGTIQAIPLEDSVYDHVVSWGVVEHDVEGPSAALREFFRVLKPGGYAYVTTPMDTRRTRELSAIECPPQEGAEFFQHFFTISELSGHLASVGFDIVHAAPATRHYAMLFPRLCMEVRRHGRIINAIANRVLTPIAFLSQEAFHMVLVVGRKPG
jgi:SAM-dependent methyltransferase